jgi:hypothetical protein
LPLGLKVGAGDLLSMVKYRVGIICVCRVGVMSKDVLWCTVKRSVDGFQKKWKKWL